MTFGLQPGDIVGAVEAIEDDAPGVIEKLLPGGQYEIAMNDGTVRYLTRKEFRVL